MSSLDVAHEATSARVPRTVVKREVLWKGPVVKVNVPEKAKMGSFPEDGKPVPFLQFPRLVTGGIINCFVHTNNPTLRGKTIVAEMTIMRKDFADGGSFLHIDFLPTHKSAAVTHRFATINGHGHKRQHGWRMFETSAPIEGTIVIAPPDAKIVESKPLPAPKPEPSKIQVGCQLANALSKYQSAVTRNSQ